jgi:Bacteriophage lambda head decoration protein D
MLRPRPLPDGLRKSAEQGRQRFHISRRRFRPGKISWQPSPYLCSLKAGTPASSSSPRATAALVRDHQGQVLEAGAVLGKVTASGKYKALDPAAVDGSEAAAGVLYGAVDASAADAEGVAIVRLAEVNAAELVWPAGITGGEQTTALGELAALSIIAR